MEIINIDQDAFRQLEERLEQLIAEIEQLQSPNQIKTMEDWLDNQEVCFMLNISPRTLQLYRGRRKNQLQQNQS